MLSNRSCDVKAVSLPVLHPKIDLADLTIDEDSRQCGLYDGGCIQLIQSLFEEDGRYTKLQVLEAAIKKTPYQKDMEEIKKKPGEKCSRRSVLKALVKKYHSDDADLVQLERISRYPIVIHGGNVYAIYKGVKHQLHLGAGSYARVKIAYDVRNDKWCAIKIQNMSKQDLQGDLDQEFAILQKLDMVVSRDAQNSPSRTVRKRHLNHQQTKQNTQHGESIVVHQHEVLMPLINGISLREFKNNKKKLPLVLWLTIAKNCLIEAKSIHDKGVLHVDTKLENAILCADWAVKYIDFGLSQIMDESVSCHGVVRGTASYLPIDFYQAMLNSSDKFKDHPCFGVVIKKLLNQKLIAPIAAHQQTNKKPIVKYDEKSEIYSNGMLIAKLLELVSMHSDDVILSLSSDAFKSNKIIPDMMLRRDILNYLKNMLDPDPAKRPTFTEAIAYFERVIKSKLTAQQKQLNVALVSVDEIVKLDDIKLKSMLVDLMRYHQVHLIYQANTEGDSLIFVMSRCLDQGVSLSMSGFESDDPEKSYRTAAEMIIAESPDYQIQVYNPISGDMIASTQLTEQVKTEQSLYTAQYTPALFSAPSSHFPISSDPVSYAVSSPYNYFDPSC